MVKRYILGSQFTCRKILFVIRRIEIMWYAEVVLSKSFPARGVASKVKVYMVAHVDNGLTVTECLDI